MNWSLLQPYTNKSYKVEHKKGREYTHKSKCSNTTLERRSQGCVSKENWSKQHSDLTRIAKQRHGRVLELCMLLKYLGAEGGRHGDPFIAPNEPLVVTPSLQKHAKNWLTASVPDRSGAPSDRVHVPRV
jgi:hypothetical protein